MGDSGKRRREGSGGEEDGLIPDDGAPRQVVRLAELLERSPARSPVPTASTAEAAEKAAIVHEMALDSTFELKEKELPAGSLEERVTTAAHNAFWDLLREDLAKDPPDYEALLRLLTELQEGLISLSLPHQDKLRERMKETVDVELVRQQLDAGAADTNALCGRVVGLLGDLCTPERDVEVAALREPGELVPRFRGVMELVTRMKRDMANFALASIRPVVAEHGVRYEREQFAAAMDGRPLPQTQLWLRGAREAVEEGPSDPKASPDDSPVAAIAAEAFLKLLQWPENRPWPETLAMDGARLGGLRDDLVRLSVTAAAFLITTKASAGLAQSAERKAGLKARLDELLKGVRQRSLSAKLAEVAEAGLEAVGESSSQDALRDALLELLRPDEAVRSLVRKRVLAFLRALVEGGGGTEGAEFPKGLAVIKDELMELAKAFLRIVTHNRAVHSERYDEIIRSDLAQRSS